jgi:hypothetical protein
MNRRTYFSAMLTLGVSARGLNAADPAHPVRLEVDIPVDPAREKELVHTFETIFRPEAAKHPGYISLNLLKLRSVMTGTAPPGISYRFSLTYASEELRLKWVASPEHQKVWPLMEKTFSSKSYTTLLFDVD